MLLPTGPIAKFYFAVLLSTICFQVSALSLEDLRSQSDLTPNQFAAHFRDFDFIFRKQIQAPEVFLASKSGDCDDYSTLAAEILREKGYTPRLVTIRMPGVTHVVCYIEETKSYLDYNNRGKSNALVACENNLSAIAASVARSYRLKWTSASEFTFDRGMKRLVKTVIESRRDTRILATIFSY